MLIEGKLTAFVIILFFFSRIYIEFLLGKRNACASINFYTVLKKKVLKS